MFRSTTARLAAFALVIFGLSATAALGAGVASGVAPHRAVYRLSLVKTGESGALVFADGVLALEWAESCESWEIQERMGLKLIDKNGQEILIDSSFSSSESKDGLTLRFNTLIRHNNEVQKDLRGTARLDERGGAGEVRFTRPSNIRMELPKGTMFPTSHVIFLIETAKSGGKHATRPVYDGDNVQAPREVSAAIGKLQPAASAPRLAPLADQAFWRFRLAYFPISGQGDSPESEITVALQADGIARELLLDFGGYRIAGALAKIEASPRPSC